MKTFKMLSSSLIVLMLLCTTVFAAGPTTPVTQVQAPARVLKFSADLLVQYIEFFNCPCSLNQVLDTEYVTDMIAVKVANTSTFNAVPAKVTVSYYDVSAKTTVTVTKNVTLNANQWTKVIMVQKPILIKKSVGVTASIEHTDAKYADPNLANNKILNYRTCGPMVE
ncbi:MAG: hypothetical protein EHM45_10070 [Desulfobacteraceae bacterium]|nr:MAG: hypothetical protein EHM45_10070 [Desulfobacteraceae bacterium]